MKADDRIKHLELIQGVVARMAGNSFLLRGWSVTVASGLFALAAKDANARFSWLAVLPILAFWNLDAYFLRQERLFRKLYDHVRTASDDTLDLDPFGLNVSEFNSQVRSWWMVLMNPTVAGLHGVLLAGAIAISIWLRHR